ncbi:sulfuric ester hydrolase [Aureococcus anophagefferens]|nr:sulfuric ester hydrolase [Aureococcus anophagefferens]
MMLARAREFVRDKFAAFAEANASVDCRAELGRGKHPVVKGAYVWGEDKVADGRNLSAAEILKLAEGLRNTSGRKMKRFDKPVLSMTPSIQARPPRSSAQAAAAVCTPRAMLTGKLPIHLELQHWQVAPSEPWGLPTREATMAQYLKALGYSTHMVGKWHLGHYNNASTPLNRGFDSFYGFYSGGVDYLTHVSQEACLNRTDFDDDDFRRTDHATRSPDDDALDEEGRSAHVYVKDPSTGYVWRCYRDLWDNERPVTDAHGQHQTSLMNERAIAVLERHAVEKKSEPIFAYNFAALMMNADESLANLTNRGLKATGLYDTAVIVIASDNGGQGALGASADELAGLKLPRGVVNDYGAIDGVDHWARVGAVDAGRRAPRDELLLNIDYLDGSGDYLGYFRAALIIGDWKFIYNEKNISWFAPSDEPNFHLNNIHVSGRLTALYNVTADPGERNDLKSHYPAQMKRMLKKIQNGYLPTMLVSNYRGEDDGCYEAWDDGNFVKPWVSDLREGENARAALVADARADYEGAAFGDDGTYAVDDDADIATTLADLDALIDARR